MEAAALRPLAVGEILDVAIKLYRAHFKVLAKAVFLIVAPLQVVTVLIQASTRPTAHTIVTTNSTTGETTFRVGVLGAVLAGNAIIIVVGIVRGSLATAASFRALSLGYLGETPDWRESLRFATSRLRSLVWLTILHAVLVFLALMACIVPGVYFLGCWLAAVPVLLFEGLRGRAALKRSRQLVSGLWWRTAATYIVGSILVSIVTLALTALFLAVTFANQASGSLAGDALSAIAGTASATLTTPFIAAVVTVLYFDLRVRKEGFDLELLARRIGVEPVPGSRPTFLPPSDGPELRQPGTTGPSDRPPFWPPPPGWRPPAPPGG